jgi:phosphatidylglycerol:prolipoprotein diacylglycerol transferase
MVPVLFKIPGIGLEVPGYGVALMIGFLLSIMWAARRAERSGANPDVILNCGFIALFGGVIGARVMYVVHYWDQFAGGTTGQVIARLIDVRKGGLEVYGGFITVVVLVLFYLWRGRHSVRWYLDIIAPSAALGMSIGRIGCFLNGCCFGGVCDLPWAVRFPYGSPAEHQQWVDRQPGAGLPQELMVASTKGIWPDGGAAFAVSRESLRATDKEIASDQPAAAAKYFDIRTQMKRYNLNAADLRALARKYPSLPVHPTELYSALNLGLLAALLSAVYWRRTRDGQVICTLLLIEPWTRWLLELLRADNPIDTLGGFTISQFLAICLSAAGLLGFLVLHHQPARSPYAKLWEPPAPLRPKSAPGQ